MGRKGWEAVTTTRRGRAVALSALIVAILLPAGLAAGSHEGSVTAGDDGSVILLTMGPRDRVTWEGLSQGITTSNNDCLVATFAASPQILEVSAIGGQLGHVKDGFGVRGPGDGAGEPCGRVTPGQAISVKLGSAVQGHLMTAIDVDLELKFNAAVETTFKHSGTTVATNVFNPTSGPDDGPDSKDGDNYRYFHRPMVGGQQVYFDEVVLSAESGAFSLEGGADLASNNEPNAFGQLDTSSKSSQFEVVPVFDGEITCQDVVVISEGGDVSGLLKMHSMDSDGWSVEDCLLKPYFSFATDDTIGFIPVLEGTSARYTIDVEATGQTITMLGGVITSLEALYDPEGDPNPTRPLQACVGQPVLDGPGYAAFWTQASTGLLPAGGETACYYAVQLLPTGPGIGTELWSIYFEDDPAFGFK